MQIQFDSDKSTGERYGLMKELRELVPCLGWVGLFSCTTMGLVAATVHYQNGIFIAMMFLCAYFIVITAVVRANLTRRPNTRNTLAIDDYTGSMP